MSAYALADERPLFLAVFALGLAVCFAVVALGALAWFWGHTLQRKPYPAANLNANPAAKRPWLTTGGARAAAISIVVVATLPAPLLGALELASLRAMALSQLDGTPAYVNMVASWAPAVVLQLGLASIALVTFVCGSLRLADLASARRMEAESSDANVRNVVNAQLTYPSPSPLWVFLCVVGLAAGSALLAFAFGDYARALDMDAPSETSAAAISQARQALTTRLLLCNGLFAGSAVLLLLGFWFVGSKRNHALQTRSPAAAGPRSGTFGRVLTTLLCTALLSATIGAAAVWRTAPIAEANALALPEGHSFSRDDSAIPKTFLTFTGPDPLPDEPGIVLWPSHVSVDGSDVHDPEKLRDTLREKQALWGQLVPGKPFPGRLRVELAEELTPASLAEWLRRVEDGLFPHVDFASAAATQMHRPLLGTFWAWKSSAVSVTLAREAKDCDAKESEPFVLGLGDTTGIAPLLEKWAALRKQGRTACLVLNAPRCEKDLSKCLARLAAPAKLVSEKQVDADVQLRRVSVREHTFDVVSVTDASRISVWQRDQHGQRLGSFGALHAEFDQGTEKLLLAMNAGMFEPDFSPVGLLVTHGLLLKRLNNAPGEGNFYLQPNGLFYVARQKSHTPDGFVVMAKPHAAVSAANGFTTGTELELLHATQSGPLLLMNGTAHPKLDPASTSVAIRNAVGVDDNGVVHLLISRDKVSLYALTEVFTLLGVDDALYLDGNRSALYFPTQGFGNDVDGLGPMLAVTANSAAQ